MKTLYEIMVKPYEIRQRREEAEKMKKDNETIKIYYKEDGKIQTKIIKAGEYPNYLNLNIITFINLDKIKENTKILKAMNL